MGSSAPIGPTAARAAHHEWQQKGPRLRGDEGGVWKPSLDLVTLALYVYSFRSWLVAVMQISLQVWNGAVRSGAGHHVRQPECQMIVQYFIHPIVIIVTSCRDSYEGYSIFPNVGPFFMPTLRIMNSTLTLSVDDRGCCCSSAASLPPTCRACKWFFSVAYEYFTIALSIGLWSWALLYISFTLISIMVAATMSSILFYCEIPVKVVSVTGNAIYVPTSLFVPPRSDNSPLRF